MTEDTAEKIYDLYWVKKGTLEECERTPPGDEFVLYQLIGRHPTSGPGSLLYIGKTSQPRGKRLSQHHAAWGKLEADEVHVRVASVRAFATWQAWHSQRRGAATSTLDRDEPVVNRIEALLIYAHQPAYCSHLIANLDRPYSASEHIRIFNTGHFGPLLPEVSTRRYVDPRQ